MNVDLRYAQLIKECLSCGERISTRNATCRRLTCPRLQEFESTPLVRARRTAWKICLREWEWFMSGSCDLRDLHQSARPWWAPWANGLGHVQHNYSQQFRCFQGREGSLDQISRLIEGIRDHPNSRRNVVTTWHAQNMASADCPITNCHGTTIQAFVENSDRLTLYAYQRSADVIVGLPHNWLQYWAFLLWLASRTKKRVGRLLYQLGDAHVYEEHVCVAGRIVEAANRCMGESPELIYQSTTEEAFRADDFVLSEDYLPVVEEKVSLIV